VSVLEEATGKARHHRCDEQGQLAAGGGRLSRHRAARREEHSVAATKTYTAQLAALALLSLSMSLPAREALPRHTLGRHPRVLEQALIASRKLKQLQD